MKKRLLLLLTCVLTLFGVSYAEDIKITQTDFSNNFTWESNSGYTSGKGTVSGISFSATNVNNKKQIKVNGNGASGFNFYNTSPIAGITKIDLEVSGQTSIGTWYLGYSDSGYLPSNVSSTTKNVVQGNTNTSNHVIFTVPSNANASYFHFNLTSNGAGTCNMTSITISAADTAPTKITFSPEDGTIDTNTKISITADGTNPTIKYSIDGTSYDQTYYAPFTLSEGSHTVNAQAGSITASKTYTVTSNSQGGDSQGGNTYTITFSNDGLDNTGTNYVTTEWTFTNGGSTFAINNVNPKTGQVRGNQSQAASNFYFYNTTPIENIKEIKLYLSSDVNTYVSEKDYFKAASSMLSSTISSGDRGILNGTVISYIPTNTNNGNYFRIQFTYGATKNTCTVSKIEILTEPKGPQKYTDLQQYAEGFELPVNQEDYFLILGKKHPVIAFSYDPAGVITINNETGLVSPLREGNTKVTASWNGDEDWEEGDVSFNVEVTKAKLIISTPVISYNDFKVNIECGTEDAVIYYTTNGQNPDKTNATEYTEAFVVYGKATVKAIAYVEDSASDIASKSIDGPYEDFESFRAIGETNSGTVIGPISVLYQNGWNTYLKDSKGGYMLSYASGNYSMPSLKNGDQLSFVTGEYSPYSGLPEIIPSNSGNITEAEEVEPIVLTLSQISEANLNAFVKVQNVNISKAKGASGADSRTYPINDGTNSNGKVVLYNTFYNASYYDVVEVPEGDGFTVIGFVCINNNNLQITPVAFIERDETKVADPVFDIEDEKEVEVGTKLTITCATEGATLFGYIGDEDIEGEQFPYEYIFKSEDLGKTITFEVWAEKEGLEDSESIERKYTVVAPKLQTPTCNIADGSKVKVGETLRISWEPKDATLFGFIRNEDNLIEEETNPFEYTFTEEDLGKFFVHVWTEKSGYTASESLEVAYTVYDPSKIVESHYSIVFAGNEGQDTTQPITSNGNSAKVSEGEQFIASFAGGDKVYNGGSNNGLKFGSTKEKGKVTINLTELGQVIPIQIVVSCAPYGSDENPTLKVNNVSSGTINFNETGFTEVIYDFTGTDEAIKSIVLDQTGGKRMFVKGIDVYYEAQKVDAGWSHDGSYEEIIEEHSATYQNGGNTYTLNISEDIKNFVEINVICEKHSVEKTSVQGRMVQSNDVDGCYSINEDGSVTLLHSGNYTISVQSVPGSPYYLNNTLATTISPLTVTVGDDAQKEWSTKGSYELDGWVSFEGAANVENYTDLFTIAITPAWTGAKVEDEMTVFAPDWMYNQMVAILKSDGVVDGYLTAEPTVDLENNTDLTVKTSCSGVYTVTFTAKSDDVQFADGKNSKEIKVTVFPSFTQKYSYTLGDTNFTDDGLNIDGVQVNVSDQKVELYKETNLAAAPLYVPGVYFVSIKYTADFVQDDTAGAVEKSGTIENGGMMDLDGANSVTLVMTKNGASTETLSFTFTKGTTTGVEGIGSEDGEAEYFDLNGFKVNADRLEKGIYIKVQNGTATKVLVK